MPALLSLVVLHLPYNHNPAELSNAQNHPLILNVPISYQCNPQTVAWSRSSKEKGKSSKMDSYPVMHTCSIVRQGKLKRPCRKTMHQETEATKQTRTGFQKFNITGHFYFLFLFCRSFLFLLTALFLALTGCQHGLI